MCLFETCMSDGSGVALLGWRLYIRRIYLPLSSDIVAQISCEVFRMTCHVLLKRICCVHTGFFPSLAQFYHVLKWIHTNRKDPRLPTLLGLMEPFRKRTVCVCGGTSSIWHSEALKKKRLSIKIYTGGCMPRESRHLNIRKWCIVGKQIYPYSSVIKQKC